MKTEDYNYQVLLKNYAESKRILAEKLYALANYCDKVALNIEVANTKLALIKKRFSY